MSFTKDKDSDNYATDKIGWEIIKDYIPKDKYTRKAGSLINRGLTPEQKKLKVKIYYNK